MLAAIHTKLSPSNSWYTGSQAMKNILASNCSQSGSTKMAQLRVCQSTQLLLEL